MSDLSAFGKERDRLLSCAKALQTLEESAVVSLDGRQQNSLDVLNIVAERLQERRFKVLVAGEFNAGKSFFINTLLDTWKQTLSEKGKTVWEGLLSVDILPATTILTEIYFGADRSERLRLRSGVEIPLESVDLSNITSLKSFSIPEYLSNKIPPMLLRAVDKINDRDREIARWLFENVDRVLVTFPSELLAEGVSLVDSPGLGAVYQEHKQVTITEMERSDCIIFLVDSGGTLSHLAESFLLDARSFVSSFLFVQTKTDQHDAGKSLEVARYNLGRLKVLTGSDCNQSYFSVSARTYRDQRTSEATGPFDDLLAAIKRHLVQNSGRRFLNQERSIIQLVLSSLVDSAQRTIDAEHLSGESLSDEINAVQATSDVLGDRLNKATEMLRSKIAAITEDLSSLGESLDFELSQAVQRVADRQNFIERLFSNPDDLISELRIVAHDATYRHGARLTREFRQLSGSIADSLDPLVVRWITTVLPTYSIPKLPPLRVSILDRLDRNHVAVLQSDLKRFAEDIVSSLSQSVRTASDAYISTLTFAFDNERLSLSRRLEALKVQQERVQLDTAAAAIKARGVLSKLNLISQELVMVG